MAKKKKKSKPHRKRPEKATKSDQTDLDADKIQSPLTFKQLLSKRTSKLLPSAQFQCVENCPVFGDCEYADPGQSCGVIDRYCEDAERELLEQMESPLPASYAILLGNTLRLLAAQAWADLHYFYTPPCSIGVSYEGDDEDVEVRLVVFQDDFVKKYMAISRMLKDNLESLALTRRKLTAPGRGKQPGNSGKGDDSLHDILRDAGVQQGPSREQ